MKRLNKKGFQLTEVPQLVIVLLVVAIVLGVSATVLTEIRGTAAMTGTATSLESDTFTADNVTVQTFNSDSDLISCGSVALYNGTNVKVVTGNFTITGCTALLSDDDALFNSSTITANYTKTRTTYLYAYNITTDGLASQDSFSGWQITFVVIIAAAVILGIIYRYLFM